MQRDIKFRLWNAIENKWELGYDMPNLGGFSLLGECMVFGEYNRVIDKFSLKDWDKIIIQQYIGLQDVNGKFIYAGDILQEVNPRGFMYRVFEVEGGFAVNTHHDDFNKDIIVFYESTADMQMSGYIKGSCAVIGNILENPELLKH